MDKHKFSRIGYEDDDELAMRDNRAVHVEAIRSPRTPPARSTELITSGVIKMGNPSPRRKDTPAESNDPVQRIMRKYSWVFQIACVNLLYFYSLSSCDQGMRRCHKLHSHHIKYWVIALIVAAFIFVTMILAIFNSLMNNWQFHGKPSTKNNFVTFMTLLNYFWLCSLDQGLNYEKHGTFSRIVFTYFIIVILLLRSFHAVMRFVKSKGYKMLQKVGLVILYVSLGVLLWHRLIGTKDSFNKGFNGDELQTDGQLCQFHKFGLNYFSAFDELFWRFAHSTSDCGKRSKEVRWWEKGPSLDGKYLAYPKTTQFNNSVRQHYELLQEQVMKNMRPVEPSRLAESESEVFLDLTADYPTVKIDVKYNQTLADQAKQVRTKEPGLARPNVLFILIDSLSRQHFFRKMPNSVKYFNDNFYGKSDQSMQGFQFFRYHALADHAEPNLLALRYDDVTDSQNSEKSRIENYFKDQGWITSSTSAKCEIEEWDLQRDQKNKIYVDRHPSDHEFYSLACDPNSMPQSDPFGMFKGPFSEFRRCLYGKDSAEYQFEYALDFWKKYRSEPKFQSITLTDGHEFTGELPYYLDDHLVDFFKAMVKEGLLDDSIVFLLSDNGNSGNFLFSGTDSGKNEAVNPFMSILLSKNNAEKYGDILKKNEQALITPHDVFRVLGELGHNFKEYVGTNFFKHELPKSRRCADVDVQISGVYCRCK